jgi:hypothetical protein
MMLVDRPGRDPGVRLPQSMSSQALRGPCLVEVWGIEPQVALGAVPTQAHQKQSAGFRV